MRSALRSLTIANEIVPVMCGSAFKNKGVQAMLDGLFTICRPRLMCLRLKVYFQGNVVTRTPADEEPFSALAFKIATDSFVGQLTFFQSLFGCYAVPVTRCYNPVKGKKERVGRILHMHSNNREEIKEVRAGDIAAAVGLKTVTTGDTLCDVKNIVTLERMEFPDPVISVLLSLKPLLIKRKWELRLES